MISRALFLSFAVALAHDSACAEDRVVSLGGFICVRPFAPACADQPDTFRTDEKLSACRLEIERFVGATATYRDCLQHQISIAVRAANDVLDQFRCQSQPHHSCAPRAGLP